MFRCACPTCALPIQGDLQVAGVTCKGRRWRCEGRRRACRVAGRVYLTHRGGGTPQTLVWFTLNTVVVVHLKHWCGSP